MQLPHHRRSRSLGDHLLRGLARAFAAGIGMEAFILAAAGMPSTHTDSGATTWSRVDQVSPPELRLMRKYDCSTTGYGDSTVPRSAIVRSDAGKLRVVSFDKGWDVYTSDSPATLIAVCLEPQR